MNKKSVIDLLKNHPTYFFICIAGLISNIGAGLTQVAVYGELAKLNAPNYYFTLAYSFSLLPSMFSSQLGAYFSYKYKWNYILIFAEILGAGLLIFPILGIKYHNFPLLIISEFSSCFVLGLIGPVLAVFTRHHFEDSELPLVSYIESYVFSTQAIIGIGIGSFLYRYSDGISYLYIDFISYLTSVFILYLFSKSLKCNYFHNKTISPENRQFKWKKFTNIQKSSFLLLLVLTCVGAPAISLLPIVGMRCSIKSPDQTVVLFLFAKVLGQLLGPFFTRTNKFDEYQRKPINLAINCLAFTACYFLTYLIASIYIGFILIAIAHIFSNIFFVIAIYAVKKNFSEDEIGIVFSRQYQAQILLIFILSLLTGFASQFVNYLLLIATTSSIGITLLIILSKKRLETISIQNNSEQP